MKLTEDKVIILLKTHLESNGWTVGDKFCLGNKRGIDIEACKRNEILLIEAKGARANNKAPNKKRKQFDIGQIKTHFGKAIVKILELRTKNPKALLAIAHPDDPDIINAIAGITSLLKELRIEHFWVSASGIRSSFKFS